MIQHHRLNLLREPEMYESVNDYFVLCSLALAVTGKPLKSSSTRYAICLVLYQSCVSRESTNQIRELQTGISERQIKAFTGMRQCFINQVPSYLSHVFTEKFDEIDTDKSGDISREELKASMSKDTPDEDIDFLLNVCN